MKLLALEAFSEILNCFICFLTIRFILIRDTESVNIYFAYNVSMFENDNKRILRTCPHKLLKSYHYPRHPYFHKTRY